MIREMLHKRQWQMAKQRRIETKWKTDIERKQEIFLLLPYSTVLGVCERVYLRHIDLSICYRPKNYLNDTDVHWFSPI